MKNLLFEKKLPSSVMDIKKVTDEVLYFISVNIALDREDYYDLKLVFNELLVNAVIHGNKEDKDKYVTLQVKIKEKGEISAVIHDCGNGYDYNEVRKREFSTNECGRGICIVNAIVDNLTFNEKGNEVKFMKKVNVNG